MTEAQSVLGSPVSDGLRRYQLCSDLLRQIVYEDPGAISQDSIRELTFWDALFSSRQSLDAADEARDRADWIGILPENDVLRFGLSAPRAELGPLALERLEERLDVLLHSISEFFHADDWEMLSEEERLGKVWSLPADIKSYQSNIESTRSELEAAYSRIEALVALINEAHSRLRDDLSKLLARFPAEITNRRAAAHDLLATTIETSLIKLSLMRARAHQALCGHRSSKNPQASLAHALEAAHAKLKREERAMEKEGAALDHELDGYAAMLALVDGGGGGFAQVVDDWTRVQKETEECKRDLRRLGWTGD